MKWFKHDSDANMDAKLQEVLLDYGLEGYGLFWYCIELIVNKISADNLTFEIEHDARIIARNTGSTKQRVEEMMRRFVELGLFEHSNGTITCLKVAKRLDQSMTNSKALRNWLKCHDNKLKCHDNVMTSADNVMKEEKRKEEKRIEPPSGGITHTHAKTASNDAITPSNVPTVENAVAEAERFLLHKTQKLDDLNTVVNKWWFYHDSRNWFGVANWRSSLGKWLLDEVTRNERSKKTTGFVAADPASKWR